MQEREGRAISSLATRMRISQQATVGRRGAQAVDGVEAVGKLKQPTRAERNIAWIENWCRVPEGRSSASR
jgi:hypothetical protein